ncbi:hypothetical protein GWK47_050051 [Chionoecetes opilio]|uniref:Uncharacterized protein n=1 Tax=Chionoecetes opilio TaxID=41210 RepID=A0A8J4Y204_CHIOP|nr:hypothetical protein GWK47_050051 [Chionoecetes opilio]
MDRGSGLAVAEILKSATSRHLANTKTNTWAGPGSGWRWDPFDGFHVTPDRAGSEGTDAPDEPGQKPKPPPKARPDAPHQPRAQAKPVRSTTDSRNSVKWQVPGLRPPAYRRTPRKESPDRRFRARRVPTRPEMDGGKELTPPSIIPLAPLWYELGQETSREHVEVNVQVGDDVDVELRGQDVIVAMKLFTGFLSRWRLVSPSQFAVSLTKDVCYIYRWLWKEKATRYALFGYTKPKAAFQKVIVTLGEEDDQLATLCCANNHCFLEKVEKVYFSIAGALFNAFTSNYSKEKNSEVHAKRKNSASVSRNQNTDKKKKQTGCK